MAESAGAAEWHPDQRWRRAVAQSEQWAENRQLPQRRHLQAQQRQRQQRAKVRPGAVRLAYDGPAHPGGPAADDYHPPTRVSRLTLLDCSGLTLRSQTLWRQIARNAVE